MVTDTTTGQQPLPVAELEAMWDLGPWEDHRVIPGGKSLHVHVRTRLGEFVVRRSYRGKTVGAMRFEHDLVAFLRRNGFPSLEVVPARTGATWAELQGRLFSVTSFVDGSRFQNGNRRHLEHMARALATYHRLVRAFRPTSEPPAIKPLNESLRERLAVMPAPGDLHGLRAEREGHPYAGRLLALLPYALEEGARTQAALDRLYPSVPVVVIHAGCRRGSALFRGDDLAVVLDFDSAHREVRALDLAVAIHDVGKVYGDPSSAEFKVPLDGVVVAAFLRSYLEVNALEPLEVEALPEIMVAKRLKRALGRFDRLVAGEPLSEGDVRKVQLEMDRVRWLRANEPELRRVMLSAGGEATA